MVQDIFVTTASRFDPVSEEDVTRDPRKQCHCPSDGEPLEHIIQTIDFESCFPNLNKSWQPRLNSNHDEKEVP